LFLIYTTLSFVPIFIASPKWPNILSVRNATVVWNDLVDLQVHDETVVLVDGGGEAKAVKSGISSVVLGGGYATVFIVVPIQSLLVGVDA